MLSGEGNEKGENTTIGLISRKSNFFLQVQHRHFLCPFLCRCFARLQRETSRNFLVTRFIEEKSYAFLFCFVLFFLFFVFSFTIVLFTPVAASIAHFLTAATNFMLFLQKKCLSPLFFLSSSSSISPALSLLASRPNFSFSLSSILFLYIPHLRT